MEEVKTLKAEREVTEKTLRDPVADIVPKFMSALKDFGDVDEESISEAHLRAEYSRLQQEVSGVMTFWGGGGVFARIYMEHFKTIILCILAGC